MSEAIEKDEEAKQPNWYLRGAKDMAFDIQRSGVNAPAAPDSRQIPLPGLASGGNKAVIGGWAGTVHGLTAEEKARNFRASLDRQRGQSPKPAAIAQVTAPPAVIQGPRAEWSADRTGEYEQRIIELEAKVAELVSEMREGQSPFRFVFPAIPNPDDPGEAAQWQEATADGSDVVAFEDGRKCVSGTAAGQILSPTNSVFCLLEIRDGSSRAYLRIGGGVDLLNADVLEVANTPSINIKGFGSDNVIEFHANTDPDGRAGGDFRFKDGVDDGAGIYFWSGNWMIDFLRLV